MDGFNMEWNMIFIVCRHVIHVSTLFYLSLSDSSPKIQSNGLVRDIAIYRYRTPEIAWLLSFIFHRQNGTFTGLYLIPSVFYRHTVARSGNSLDTEHLFACIMENNLSAFRLIFTYRSIVILHGVRVNCGNGKRIAFHPSQFLQVKFLYRKIMDRITYHFYSITRI